MRQTRRTRHEYFTPTGLFRRVAEYDRDIVANSTSTWIGLVAPWTFTAVLATITTIATNAYRGYPPSSPLVLLTPSLFHYRLKPNFFTNPFYPRIASTSDYIGNYYTDRIF